jgi:hypothetical protein
MAMPSSLGMAIYQSAYRSRLIAALETSYERTRRWTGEAAFTAAACHYIIAHPPTDWTLDSYGDRFPAVLAELFAGDPEVPELAWLEWQMHQAFTAPDRPELTAQALVSAGLADADWERVRLTMATGYTARTVAQDCAGLWQAMNGDHPAEFTLQPVLPGVLVVWRKGFSPHYRVLGPAEFAALECLADGELFGDAAQRAGDPAVFGGWFAQWLSEGLFADLELARDHSA